MFQNDHFVPYIFERCVDVRVPHVCSSGKKIPIGCIDEQGIPHSYILLNRVVNCCFSGVEHQLQFISCACEPLPLTLVRARLWPGSAQFLRYAFTFGLLDWAEALLLECHVAMKDFCTALYFKCPFQQPQVKLIVFMHKNAARFFLVEKGHVSLVDRFL